jgi:hypothetical protein
MWTLSEQFPPIPMLLVGFLTYCALDWSLQGLSGGEGPIALTWRVVPGALSVTLLALILRVYDELKDADSDRRLAAAGDTRYTDRPIVTGAITEDDLHTARWLTSGVLFVSALSLGLKALIAFALVYFVFWLSFKWYFYPKIQQSLFLALVTHNPLTLVVELYVVSMFWVGAAIPGPLWALGLLLLGLWFPLTAWETSRKIRLPEMETDYETYSKIFGWRGAACVSSGLVLISLGCLIGFGQASRVGGAVLYGVLGLGALIALGGALRLLLKPTPAATRLRPFMEVYSFATQAGLCIAWGVSRGVSLEAGLPPWDASLWAL